jgi:hypothetical protein
MKKYLSHYPDVSLIIVGVGLDSEKNDELNDLCKMTKDVFFLQSIESEDLDIAF